MSRRISFSESDAVHIYEWLVMYWHGDEDAKTHAYGGCYSCQQLGTRLETFIGPKDAAMVRRVVRKNPGKKAKS